MTHDPEAPHPYQQQGPYQPYPQHPPVPQHPVGYEPGQPGWGPRPVPVVPAHLDHAPYAPPYVPPYVPPYAGLRPPASGLYVAAAVINWVVLGFVVLGTCGIGILAAAWFVPMTICLHQGARDRRKHTALGVCTLLFCNVVSGILVLVEDSSHR